ncbi:ATP synthase subunit C [Rhodobacterales bacterium HTCC2654]|uniref:ATP synthase subunit C n=1 Tax=Maritimibacter alkaliphilus HTCC2654 TaxID=314271 RepID=A3VC41_9RHOB|nr:ATP synthase subunit C [Rhodobacterales bacterium HTCC2654] [Maritimibacter alkaliphilus HTCC2654]
MMFLLTMEFELIFLG